MAREAHGAGTPRLVQRRERRDHLARDQPVLGRQLVDDRERSRRARRHVPVVTVALDTPARTAASFAIIDELTAEHGLVTSELVPALAAMDEPRSAGAVRLARHSF